MHVTDHGLSGKYFLNLSLKVKIYEVKEIINFLEPINKNNTNYVI